MESTLSTTTSLLSMAKTLNPSPNPFVSRLHRKLPSTRPGPLASLQLRRLFTAEFRRPKPLNSVPYSSNSLRSLCAVGVHRLGCVGSSAASFASVSGDGEGDGGGIGGSGGGGGGGASDGGEAESKSVVGGAEEVSALSPDVIILDVGSQVSSASVNLATETAIVWPVSEAKVIPNWQKLLGETLAKHLTSCGFKSNFRGQGDIEGEITS